LKPAWANSSKDPISKKIITKRAGGMAQGVGPEFKPQYLKKKKLKRFSLPTKTLPQASKQTNEANCQIMFL
jgi:hypothetical protein